MERRYDVFISYRRDKGSEIARLVSLKLREVGYRVFLDVDGLGSGEWDKELSQRIEECPDFIAVVTEGYFDRCCNEDDVVRREIAHAIATNRNTVPLLIGVAGFPPSLPPEISAIASRNGIRYLHEYSEQAIRKVGSFLATPPAVGPQRLATGQPAPRLVVFSILMLVGTWNGAIVGDGISDIFSIQWMEPVKSGLVRGFFFLVLLVLPVILMLSLVAQKRHLTKDSWFLGPWLPFWAISIQLTFMVSSVFSYVPQKLLLGHGFVTGAFLGAASSVFFTRLAIRWNAWGWLMRCIDVKSR